MRHFINHENAGLVAARQFGGKNHFIAFITRTLIEISSQPFAPYTVFPLYLYPDENSFDKDEPRRPNLNIDIVKEIARKTGLAFTAEKQDDAAAFAPIDLLDYIYAVLYSNSYRAKYREFLKIDFPRVPCPENAERFQKLIFIGSMLRGLHLMENVSPAMGIADFPVTGTNKIETLNYKEKNVYVNKQQYFANVPLEAWEYYIGGYQPAQKWLKDRKGRVLSFDDIEHYQKIITVLKMTMELQAQIDGGLFLHN
jgi:predicted helicase